MGITPPSDQLSLAMVRGNIQDALSNNLLEMNARAFVRNLAQANAFCRGAVNRVKYLAWLYGSSVPLLRNRCINLGFELPQPVGKFSLTVRTNGGSDAFIFSEVFEHKYYDFDLATEPMTILDLGANIGLTALFFARKYPGSAIACMEPMPGNLGLLRSNLERNGAPVRVFANAVAVRDQEIVMEIAAHDYGHKVSTLGNSRSLDGQTLCVTGLSVPTVLGQLNWKRVGLLKIDIEGYENVLLRENCEWLECVDAICIECHEGYGEADLQELAARFGFSPPKQLAGTMLIERDPAGTPAMAGRQSAR